MVSRSSAGLSGTDVTGHHRAPSTGDSGLSMSAVKSQATFQCRCGRSPSRSET